MRYKFATDYLTSLLGHEGRQSLLLASSNDSLWYSGPESVLYEIKSRGLGTSLTTKMGRFAKGLEYLR